jgi:hypothetical protein
MLSCCRCSVFNDSVESLDNLRNLEQMVCEDSDLGCSDVSIFSKVEILFLGCKFFLIKEQGEQRGLREYRFIFLMILQVHRHNQMTDWSYLIANVTI